MDIFSFITLFGGLAFFLYGMHLLSESLKKTAGGKLEKLLKKATANSAKGLLVGALITIAIQSSSAMTVMLVGFVNSGIIEVPQTIGVIFGSDIGTTLTAWILSLSGIDGNDSVILQFLKPSCFALLVALIGIIMIMVCKQQRNKDFGTMFIAFFCLHFSTCLADTLPFQRIISTGLCRQVPDNHAQSCVLLEARLFCATEHILCPLQGFHSNTPRCWGPALLTNPLLDLLSPHMKNAHAGF